jgi:hypothetical protein
MARNKNSTALFDVIHSAKKPPRPSPSASIPTPKWWGKNKTLPKALPTTPVVESTENVGRQKSWLTAARRNGVNPIPQNNAPATPVQEPVWDNPTVEISHTEAFNSSQNPAAIATEPAPPETPAQPRPRFIDRFAKKPAPADPIVETPATPSRAVKSVVESVVESVRESVYEPDSEPTTSPIPEPTPEPMAAEIKPERSRSREDRDPAMRIDSAAGDIRFRLSYAGVAAIAFIFTIALAIAYLAGKRTVPDSEDASPAPKTTAAASSPASATNGLMVAVGPSDGQSAPASPADSVHSDVLSVPPRPPRATDPGKSASAALPIKTTREIGMMYVVVQSYAEQELAQKACDFMNRAGVPCTLVQGPANWAPRDWYSVVGLQPFARHDPAMAEYERAVKALGMKFTSRTIDQFQPQGYTWREDSDLAQP